MRLWHYTCSHSIQGILGSNGTLRPNPNAGVQPRVTALAKSLGHEGAPIRALPLVWLTDVYVKTHEDAALIGLKGLFTECDRVEYRFRVPSSTAIQWWPTWAEANLDAEDEVFRSLLEMGCLPHRWWVAARPISGCRLDETYLPPLM